MATEADFTTGAQPSLQQLATFIVDELFAEHRLERLQNAMQNAHAKGAVTAQAATVAAGPSMGQLLEDGYEKSKDLAQRSLGAGLGWLVGEILGIEVSPAELFHARRDPEQSAVGAAIAEVAFKAIRGPAGELEPSEEGAKRLLGTLAHIITHCWAEGIILEKVEGYTSWSGHIEEISHLAKELVDTLGLSRAARTAIRPLVRAVISTPLEWKTNKTYRPTLLSESLAVREFLRGTYSREELDEELARQGWSAKRIQAHINATARELSIGDALQLGRHGQLDRAAALAALRAAGYDEATAELALVAEETRHFDSFNDNPLTALKSAYVNRELSEAQFKTFLPAIFPSDIDAAAYASGAAIERGLNVKHLSHGEVIDCVKKKILSRLDYRHWLEREGYPPEDAAALELRLVVELNDAIDIEKERARIAEQRAADKALKDLAAAQRRADVEAERALHRRGSLGDLERAAVRGLIPLARVEEVLASQYDADTVAILLELVEGDRVAYVEQQQRAADAKQRAQVRRIDIGDIEQAVLNDVLTIADYRGRLVGLGFDAGDAAILSATLEARKSDLDDARAKRAAADTAAKTRSIDLGRFERLVRRGVRSFAQYDALLLSLGFDDGSRAAMADLLRLDIADDEAARKAREAPKPPPDPKGLTLEQFRRAVLLGIETDDAFQSYLVKAGYTSDAQRVLLAELRRDVVDADAARRKREEAEAASAVVAIPLSRLARAARLGLVSPATYQARLAADGYTDDDIAIDMELLLVEIADERAAQQRRDELAATLDAPRALTLEQIAQAVRAGTESINAYRLALSQVYEPSDVELLVRTLQRELDTLNDAAARRVTIEGELTARTLSIGDLEAGVKAGALTFEQYRDQLLRWGYGLDDAELLTALLADKLSAAPAGGDGG